MHVVAAHWEPKTYVKIMGNIGDQLSKKFKCKIEIIFLSIYD